jgi:hypothetical protein
MVEGKGEFGSNTIFSGRHRALRLQLPAADKFVTIRYIVFDTKNLKDEKTGFKALEMHLASPRSPKGDVRDRLLSELMKIFDAAMELWGSPTLSLAESVLDEATRAGIA